MKLDPKTIQEEQKSNLVLRLISLDPDVSHGLECKNTGEIVKDQVDILYPGLT